jgi:GNAT superfamily N-acetyltransferase
MKITALRETGSSSSSYRLAWVAATGDGSPAATAYLRVFTVAGAGHRAEAEIYVHPAERRRGVGGTLLDTVVAAGRELGKRTLIAGPVDAGSAGESFLTARGLRPVLSLTYTRLALTDDPPQVATPAGYRLISWEGTVPDELAATFAESRRAMDDMPMDDADFGVETWDVDRVRAIAAAITERGDILCTVAALDESDGTIAGFTELVVPGSGTGDAQHYGTGVLPAHRGHGLARWMKIEAIRHTRTRHPGITGLLADTADSNTVMRKINDSLGYAPTHRSVLFQLDL